MTEEQWKALVDNERTTVRLQKQELAKKDKLVTSLEKQNQLLRSQLEQKAAELGSCKSTLQDKQRDLEQEETEHQSTERKFNQCQQKLSDLKNKVQNYAQVNNALNINIMRKEKTINKMQKKNDDLYQQLEESELSHAHKDQILATQESTIANLNKLIQNLEEQNRKLNISWAATDKRSSSSSSSKKKQPLEKRPHKMQQGIINSLFQQQQRSTLISTPGSASSSSSTHSSDLDRVLPAAVAYQRSSSSSSSGSGRGSPSTQSRSSYATMNGIDLFRRSRFNTENTPLINTTPIITTPTTPTITSPTSRSPRLSRTTASVNTNINVNNEPVEEQEYEVVVTDDYPEEEEECDDEEEEYYEEQGEENYAVEEDYQEEEEEELFDRTTPLNLGPMTNQAPADSVEIKEEETVSSRTAAKRSLHDVDKLFNPVQKKRSITPPAAEEEGSTSSIPQNYPRHSSPSYYFDNVHANLTAAADAQEQQQGESRPSEVDSNAEKELVQDEHDNKEYENGLSLTKEKQQESTSHIINLSLTPSPPSPPPKGQSYHLSSQQQERREQVVVAPLRPSLSDTTNLAASSSNTTTKDKQKKNIPTKVTGPTKNYKQNKKPVSLNITTVTNLIPQITNAAASSSSSSSASRRTTTTLRHNHGQGETCIACEKFYNSSGNLYDVENNNELLTPKDRIRLHSRHKTKPGRATTPPGFWSIDNFTFSPDDPRN